MTDKKPTLADDFKEWGDKYISFSGFSPEEPPAKSNNLPDEVKTKIFESLGTASMCWSETPRGVFDSDLAVKIGNELCDFIYQKMQPRENNPTA